MGFAERTAHGDAGEALAKKTLGTNYTLSGPWKNGMICPEGPHDYDLRAKDEEGFFWLGDIKTKARRNIYPDQGINAEYYKVYRAAHEAAKNDPKYLDFCLIFVDEDPRVEAIYALRFSVLDRLDEKSFDRLVHTETDWRGYRTVYFSLDLMEPIRKLTRQEAEQLRALNTRRHEYAS